MGVSSGMKTKHSIPAAAAYAASAPPALPAVGAATRVMPSSFAIDTAIAMPRDLNEPVGKRDSSLMSRFRMPNRLPSRSARSSGVMVSPSDTMFSSRSTGSSSRYRHIVVSRARKSSRFTALPIASRSYRTHSGRPSCVVWIVRAGRLVPSIAASRWVTNDGIAGQSTKEQEIGQPLGNDGFGHVDHEVGDDDLVVPLELAPDLVASGPGKHGMKADHGAGALIGTRRRGECDRMTVQIGVGVLADDHAVAHRPDVRLQ